MQSWVLGVALGAIGVGLVVMGLTGNWGQFTGALRTLPRNATTGQAQAAQTQTQAAMSRTARVLSNGGVALP